MDESILEELATRFDVPGLRERAAEVPDRRVQGFDPRVIETEGWRLSMAELLEDGAERPMRRAIFDEADAPVKRVMVEVVECSNASDALDVLLDRLAGNQLAHLPEGPPELGFAVFEHPEEAPPAIFFARDNLCVTVASFGSKRAAARLWAERVVEELEGRGRELR